MIAELLCNNFISELPKDKIDIVDIVDNHLKKQLQFYFPLESEEAKNLIDVMFTYGILEKQNNHTIIMKKPTKLENYLRITNIIDIPHLELARQLTMFEYSVFMDIRFSELMNLNWMGNDKFKKSPKIM